MQQLQIPPLNEGETYIGFIADHKGEGHHIILLPGDNDDATWQEQMDWAKSIGGDLPTRVEQALLWKNHRDLFKKDWYWSSEQHVSNSDYAWVQNFNGGGQYYNGSNDRDSARAVRRLPI